MSSMLDYAITKSDKTFILHVRKVDLTLHNNSLLVYSFFFSSQSL